MHTCAHMAPDEASGLHSLRCYHGLLLTALSGGLCLQGPGGRQASPVSDTREQSSAVEQADADCKPAFSQAAHMATPAPSCKS